MKRLLGLMAATALAAGALPAAAQASASDTPNSLFATAAASLGDNGGNATDKNWYDFDILANAVVALGLDGALKDDGPGGSGLDSATVFAPNDRAFQQLVADITNTPWWRLSEAQTLQTLLTVAGSSNLNNTGIPGAAALKQTVLYHVSGENITNLRSRSFGPN
ncbi:MAG: fasciclin domain-containing protein, partial [Solirubrobacteraceae bacterium]|nr:fasciclin domain-containing protein [Solirubrobacteraceae bacterium]